MKQSEGHNQFRPAPRAPRRPARQIPAPEPLALVKLQSWAKRVSSPMSPGLPAAVASELDKKPLSVMAAWLSQGGSGGSSGATERGPGIAADSAQKRVSGFSKRDRVTVGVCQHLRIPLAQRVFARRLPSWETPNGCQRRPSHSAFARVAVELTARRSRSSAAAVWKFISEDRATRNATLRRGPAVPPSGPAKRRRIRP